MILHPRGCRICLEYAGHYGAAIILGEHGMKEARQEHGAELRDALHTRGKWRNDYYRTLKDLEAAQAEIAALKEKLDLEQA